MVLKSTPDEIPITAYKLLVNMFTDQENSISVRKGFSRFNDGLPATPHSSFIIRDYDGVVWRYAICAAQLYIAQVSPNPGAFTQVTGGSNLSIADDPRAFFGSYTLTGSELKPFMFFTDGKALLKHSGGSNAARRVGIPRPLSPITNIAIGTAATTGIEDFESKATWTPDASMTLADVTGIVGTKAMSTLVSPPDTTGSCHKPVAATTIDLNQSDLTQSIQVYMMFPSQDDIDAFGVATIQFGLSLTPSDVTFENIMWCDVPTVGLVAGVWNLVQIPKNTFQFSGPDPSLTWANVTAINLIVTPIAGALTPCNVYWDQMSLNKTGQVATGVSTTAPDLKYTFTYYNSKTDTESDYADTIAGPTSGVIEYGVFDLTFPPCPLTTPPMADPDKIRIYRMGATITQFQLVDEIPYTPGAIPPVYTDSTPDSALGDVLETDNQLPPDNVAGLEFSDNRLWTWGGSITDSTGTVVNEPPNRLRFSKRTRVELFPAENYIYVGTGSEAIQRVMENDGELFVFTLTRVYRVTGADLNSYQAPSTAINKGLMSPFGVCRGDRQIFMYCYDGVYEFPSGTKISELINPIFFNETVNEAPAIQKGREHEIAMAFWNSKLYFSYPRLPDITVKNDNMLVWDIIYSRWHYYLYGCQGLFFEPETKLLAGSNVTQWDALINGVPLDFAFSGAWVMQMENGFFDQCESGNRGIFYAMDTKEFDLGYPDQEKRFIDYVFDVDTLGYPVRFEVTFDGWDKQILGDVRTTRRDQFILPCPMGEGEGFLARRSSIRVISRQSVTAIRSTKLFKVIHRVLLEPMKHRTFVTEWYDYGSPNPKFFRELWIELDTFGFPLDRIEVQIDQALGATIKANTTANGRTKFFYGLPPDLRGTLARLKIVPQGENEVKLYDHSIQTLPEPPQINSYQVPWSEEQWPYPKLWKEIIFDIDTNNTAIGFDFWVDGKIKQSFDIRTDGRALVTKSLDKDLFGKLGRVTVNETFLDPFCCLPQGVRVYSIRFVIDKDPADVTFSDTYEQLFSYDRTKVIRRLWLAMKNPDSAVTMQLYADDVLASTKTISIDRRVTGHNKRRIDLESNIEGRLFRILFSSPFAFQLYWEKSEVEMKGTNPEDGYGRVKLSPPQTL
jgi:hypothetical protein